MNMLRHLRPPLAVALLLAAAGCTRTAAPPEAAPVPPPAAATPAATPPPPPARGAPAPDPTPACRVPEPPAAPGTVRVLVYFTCADALHPVPRRVPATAALLRAAVAELLRGPLPHERAAGFTSWFSAATAGMLRSALIADGRAVLDFADLRPIIPSASTSAGSRELLGQLTTTVAQFPHIATVEYRLAGSCAAFWEWLQVGGCPPVPTARYRIDAPGPALGYVPVPGEQGDWRASGDTPEAAARQFVLAGRPCPCQEVAVKVLRLASGEADVTVRLAGMQDDAIQALEYRLTLHNSGGRWQVLTAAYLAECRRGATERGLCA